MIRILIIILVSIQSLQGVWLTYEEAVLNSPFKTASIGWTIPFPNEDAVLMRGRDDDWKKWFKVDLVRSDTTLFLDSLAFNWNGDDLFIEGLTISESADKILIRTDSKKIWRYSHLALEQIK